MQNPRPDIAVQYRAYWPDPEGEVIVMDEHEGTLRRWITPSTPLYESDWFPIMSGIMIRLAAAHAIGALHTDLKPSNSTTPSRAPVMSFDRSQTKRAILREWNFYFRLGITLLDPD
jgi:hypothetical protein